MVDIVVTTFYVRGFLMHFFINAKLLQSKNDSKLRLVYL